MTAVPRCRDHALIDNFMGQRECRIESDWLLTYRIDAPHIIFERIGRHVDLFNKIGFAPTHLEQVYLQALPK